MVVIGGESEVVPRHYYHSSISADLELSTVDVFDLTTRSWTSVATTVSPRKQPGSRAAETKPQVDGFPQRRSGATTSLKSHITHARTRNTMYTISCAVSGHAAVVLKGDRILICGGTNKLMVQDRCFWVLHTSTDASTLSLLYT